MVSEEGEEWRRRASGRAAEWERVRSAREREQQVEERTGVWDREEQAARNLLGQWPCKGRASTRECMMSG